jgi:homogentisate 1,2-dioxygenase
MHEPFAPYSPPRVVASFHAHSPEIEATPQQLRWDPLELPNAAALDFVDGMATLAGAGDSQTKDGLAVHVYCCGQSMHRKAFYNSDGDMLIVPQQGALRIRTEFGTLDVPPLFICVVQRGIKFSVDVVGLEEGAFARGYICGMWSSRGCSALD